MARRHRQQDPPRPSPESGTPRSTRLYAAAAIVAVAAIALMLVLSFSSADMTASLRPPAAAAGAGTASAQMPERNGARAASDTAAEPLPVRTGDTAAGTSARRTPVLRNGGAGEPLAFAEDADWKKRVLKAFPEASTLGLRDENGSLVAQIERTCIDSDKRCAESAARGDCARHPRMRDFGACPFSCNSCGARKEKFKSQGALPRDGRALYTVVDDHPFIWPTSSSERTVEVGPDGESLQLRSLSSVPRVFEVEGLASAEECAAIQRLSEPGMSQSGIYTETQQERAVESSRTSSNSFLPLPLREEDLSEDEARLRAVWLRIAALVRMDPRAAEDMQVIRYDVGDRYYYHVDNGGAGTPGTVAGRVATVLLYLNGGFTGGETNFPLADEPGEWQEKFTAPEAVFDEYPPGCQTARGLSVVPKMGSALIFYDLLPNSATPDLAAWHGSCDVTRGRKWAANLWFSIGLEEMLRSGYRPFGRRPGRSIFGPNVIESGEHPRFQVE